MGSYKPIPKTDQAAELVHKIRQDAIVSGDYNAYRAARELRDTLESMPSPAALHLLEELLIRDDHGGPVVNPQRR